MTYPSNSPGQRPARRVAESAADVPEQLRKHYQFPDDFCAVSGFESIAKLERLIRPDEFPLQSDRANLSKGFEPAHRTFLGALGLDAKDEHLKSGNEATMVIANEIDAGRFPLVSMPVQDSATGRWGYHVYVFAKDGGEALFIDPAVPKVILRGLEDLPQALDNWRTRHPLKHKTIHLLTYVRQTERAKNKNLD